MRARAYARIAVMLLVSCGLFGTSVFGFARQTAAAETDGIRIMFHKSELDFADPLYIRDDRVFVPIRLFAETFGGEVSWNEETEETIVTTLSGDRLGFRIADPIMSYNGQAYRMDVAPFLDNRRTYVPIRHAAEFLHMQVAWDQEALTAMLTEAPWHVAAESETLAAVGEAYQASAALLGELNGFPEDEPLAAGTKLKTFVPLIMAEKIAPPEVKSPEQQREEAEAAAAAAAYEADLMLLAQIVQAEAGYESYDSQLAVANVVMNRVRHEAFPNTIRDVIYAPNQFTPAMNGSLEGTKPGDAAIRAAEAALAGENNVEGALYFYNPDVTSGSFWNSLTLIAVIGNHRYMGR